MAYSAELVDRVRGALSGRGQLREVKMFGGLAFMLDDRMVVTVGGPGDLLVRIAPEHDAELVVKPGAHRAMMGRDRSMGEGWIAVDRQALQSEPDLQFWIDAALAYHAQGSGSTAKRPPKRPGARSGRGRRGG